MKLHQEEMTVDTSGRGLTNITQAVAQIITRSGVRTGLCTVFLRHTSAGLLIQENADPSVQRDLSRWVEQLAPESREWEHSTEGADDMPAHLRAVLTRTSETIPITRGHLALGTWQALYLYEHRASPHERRLVVHITGE